MEPYGRVLPLRFMFEFDIVFEFVLIFEFDIFEFDIFEFDIVLTVAIGVAIGVGLDMFTFEFRLLAALLAPVSPQPAPMAPIANTAVSAIFFMIRCDLLSSSKLLIYLTAASAYALFCPKRNNIVWDKGHYMNPFTVKSTRKIPQEPIIWAYCNLGYRGGADSGVIH